ncbi:MAG: c-type cytochrome [Bacteroidia bacterium]
MMKMSVKYTIFFGISALVATSCTKHEDSPGYEYMPDMYRSPAIEAYVDYGLIGDSVAEDLQNTLSAKLPPTGTIAYNTNAIEASVEMPYIYPNTIEGYEAAGLQLKNPLKFSEADLEKGKDLYTKFCQHCHGTTGKGDGGVITYGRHSKPGAFDVALKDLPEGKMFHTLTYGKGMMGSHASQLTKTERWKIIFYVQALQNGGKHPLQSIVPSVDSTAIVVDSTTLVVAPKLEN